MSSSSLPVAFFLAAGFVFAAGGSFGIGMPVALALLPAFAFAADALFGAFNTLAGQTQGSGHDSLKLASKACTVLVGC